MTMQFIWQGCDSLLAAPLVLDLVRFTERAWQGRPGRPSDQAFLSSFFKSPLAVEENDFHRQFQDLEAWAAALVRPVKYLGQFEIGRACSRATRRVTQGARVLFIRVLPRCQHPRAGV